MRAINHALTGALIGLTVEDPIIAAPAAFLSHFVCDAIPHNGVQRPSSKLLRTALFRNSLYIDAALCVLLVIVLAARRPTAWFQAAVCAFLAASPDLFWIPRYVQAKRRGQWRPNWFSKFAGGIQWFQRPIGAVVEIVWFIGAITLLLQFLR